jgi:hypothetical protein
VIEDGVHYRYVVTIGGATFTFDRADVQADGSWKNVNPKLRTLPLDGSVPLTGGTPVEIIVQNQRVVSIRAVSTPVPADPLRIPPGVIEDGVHYGYLGRSGNASFSFDRADILPDGSWKNTNPKMRTLPFSQYIPWPSGTPIQVIVDNQRVTWVTAL